MKTIVINKTSKQIETDIEKVANILKNGGTVAFPTETVYGLGANALDEEAVGKIFKAKGRPSDNPLIVHIADIQMLDQLAEEVTEKQKKIIEAFWPGPLTLILKKKKAVPDCVTGGLDTVAIRYPDHPLAQEIIRKATVPIAAPSANLSGKPSPTKGEHVVEDLKGRVDAIVLGEDCKIGIESTVLDTTGEIPMILRPGGVSREDLERVVGTVEIDRGLDAEGHVQPKSPGMKYTHYAPKAKVIVYNGNSHLMVEKIIYESNTLTKQGKKVGIMACDETQTAYEGCVKSLGSRQDMQGVASKLFHTLRDFDKEAVDIILAESFESKGLGVAVMNRLVKSAGYNMVNVKG